MTPRDSLRRRILALVALGFLTALLSAVVLFVFQQYNLSTRTRLAEFHGPTLVAAQEARVALGELNLQEAAPRANEDDERARARLRLGDAIEQSLTQVVTLQSLYAWDEAASVVDRLERQAKGLETALSLESPVDPPRIGALRLTLDQLRLLHQDQQFALLRDQETLNRRFPRLVLPLLALLVAGGAAATALVWRGIDHSLAREAALQEGLLTEVKERRQVEAELRLKDTAIATSINGIVIANAKGRIVYANPAFCAMWRVPDSNALWVVPIDTLWHRDGDNAETTAPHSNWSGEVTAVRLDGSRFPALLSSTVVRDAQHAVTHVMASFIDVTEARAAQAQLIQSQKLESVGRLAGGVAHDFNNLLLVIKGYIEMAQAEAPPDSALARDLFEVARAADSAAALTAQMLTVSRRQIIAPVILDMNAVVRRIHGMLHRVLGEDIVLRVDTAGDLWRVRFDPGQAEQILLNLAANARDAMPTGGQLTIETTNVHLDDGYTREHPGVVPGDYVMLAVSDTGAGMDAETLEHAFEPFFTTKAAGHGTGLGLAIIHGAVSQNGGRIEVYSELRHGTTFKIFLPRTHEAAPAKDAHAGAERPRGHETIMVVEDDHAVRTLARRLLERQGYHVRVFGEPAAALEWLRTSDEPIHLLFTDVIMPGMNGKELAAQVIQMRPEIRVLYVSGYTANVIVLHGVLKPGTEFLAKPYTQEALSTKVRQVLDASL